MYRTIITNATTFVDKNKSQRSLELQINTSPQRVKENTDMKLTDWTRTAFSCTGWRIVGWERVKRGPPPPPHALSQSLSVWLTRTLATQHRRGQPEPTAERNISAFCWRRQKLQRATHNHSTVSQCNRHRTSCAHRYIETYVIMLQLVLLTLQLLLCSDTCWRVLV